MKQDLKEIGMSCEEAQEWCTNKKTGVDVFDMGYEPRTKIQV